MKHNKLIFAILAFIVIASMFVYVGSIYAEYTGQGYSSNPSLFVALVGRYFPAFAAVVGGLYFIKYMIERKQRSNGVVVTSINLSRALLSALVFFAWFFSYFIDPVNYVKIKGVLGYFILALFAVELGIWAVSLINKKKA